MRDSEVTKDLIKEKGNPIVHEQDKLQRTLLHKVQNGNAAKVLIKYGSNIESKDKFGNSPLHLAQNKNVAEVLIKAGADVNARNNDGKTPIHVTSSYLVAEVLIENGADPNIKDNQGSNAYLHHLMDAKFSSGSGPVRGSPELNFRKSHRAIAYYLKNKVEDQTIYFRTPLHRMKDKIKLNN